MAIVLHNALLVDIDPPGVQLGGLRIDGDRIVQIGQTIERSPGEDVIDCDGAVVMPGLVNGHTHLYAALAVGMPPPARPPTNFLEILQHIWWRLDRALDADAIELSALIGALDAIRCGTTTLIDHHASPSCIAGSLDLLERGIERVGLRGVLCYETTDRNGRAAGERGLEENRRYLEKCAAAGRRRFAGLVGAHASFTLEGETLASLAQLAEQTGTGVHMHVAEDPCDDASCRRDFEMTLLERLAHHGLIAPGSIFAHGIHLGPEAIGQISAAGVTLAHNPRSNMNNSVGYAPVAHYRGPVVLGTDGIGADMFTEGRHAWFKARDARANLSPEAIVAMLAAGARRASQALGVTLGRLSIGAAADVVVTDYRPATPLTASNLAGHFLFGLGPQHVRHVIVDGRWVLRDHTPVNCNESESRRAAVPIAEALWKRMQSLA